MDNEIYYQQQPPSSELARRLKLVGLFLLVIVIVLVALFTVHKYVLQGGLVVFSGQPGTNITVSSLQNISLTNQRVIHLKPGREISLSPGQYVVSVTNNITMVKKIVQIKARLITKTNLNPPPLSSFDPVSSLNTSDLNVSSSNMTFLDNGRIYQIDTNNNLSSLDNSTQFSSIQWSSSGTGVALSKSGGLFIINGGSVNRISYPPLQ